MTIMMMQDGNNDATAWYIYSAGKLTKSSQKRAFWSFQHNIYFFEFLEDNLQVGQMFFRFCYNYNVT